MSELLQQIFNEMQGFVSWFWNKLAPPERKPWCAAFYFVAQQDATLDYPETTLDQKMAEAVEEITKAAAAVKANVHVVYRTIPANPVTADPVAKAVRFMGPETSTKFFPDCYETSSVSLVDTGEDLTCFLKWVYKWCPADHYAIFIWGHSFGPAGLFEPGSGVKIPKPGLAALREAFEEFLRTRLADRPKTDPPPSVNHRGDGPAGGSGGVNPADPGGAVQAMANEGDKVEIVLFHDCWMSTLETAFEIAGSASRMVASQSLLPIGTLYADFMWPYKDLLHALNAPTFAEDMTNLIINFYQSHFSAIQALPTIPVTLFDLSVVPELAQPVSDLVTKLRALTREQRKPLIELGRLAELNESVIPIMPTAGDGALLDMLTLCKMLKSRTGPEGASAGVLETALKKLITINVEAHAASTADLGFLGASAFHWPPVGVPTDTFITHAVESSVGLYKSLEFVAQTKWDQLALENKP